MSWFRRNIESVLVLIGLFINFFGREISGYVGKNYLDLPDIRLIDKNDFYDETIFELILVFISIVVLILISSFFKKGPKINNDSLSSSADFNKILKIIIIGFLIIFLLDINWSFNTEGRGSGQFDRDLGSSLSRLRLLFFPIFTYYLIISKGGSKLFVFSAILIVALYSISSGGRREIMYLAIIGLLYLYGYSKITKAQIKRIKYLIPLVVLVTFLSSIQRSKSQDELSVQTGFFIAAASILGGIGTNGILWQVKEFVAYKTGLLMGVTFINYFKLLFLPSFVLFILYGNEYTERSSFLFDKLYNVSTNMGYDFMLIADFYWNFGYFGYLVFIVFVLFIVLLSKKLKFSGNPLAKTMAILIVMYLVVSLRSDLGFFLKSVFYNFIVLFFLNKFRFVALIKKESSKCVE